METSIVVKWELVREDGIVVMGREAQANIHQSCMKNWKEGGADYIKNCFQGCVDGLKKDLEEYQADIAKRVIRYQEMK